VFGYLDTLDEDDLERKARIPLFKPLLGTDDVPLGGFVGAMLERHWNAHVEQLAKGYQTPNILGAVMSILGEPPACTPKRLPTRHHPGRSALPILPNPRRRGRSRHQPREHGNEDSQH
jgi:hypothetical protein